MSAQPKPRKPRKCKLPTCRREFVPQYTTTQRYCGPSCALAAVRAEKAKAERKERRKRLVALRTVSDWTALAQAEFNRYIRLRDKFQPCVSCGSFEAPGWLGGGWDCGHFRSVGAAPELRFEELNAAKQCKPCNGGRNQKRGYQIPLERQMAIRDRFREELVRRIGLEKVEWLEGPHEPKRYRIPELIAIRDEYRAKCKTMRAI